MYQKLCVYLSQTLKEYQATTWPFQEKRDYLLSL
jgi:hypothetical protein